VHDGPPDLTTSSPESGTVPPSAAGLLEPYGVRTVVHAAPGALDAAPFLKALLESVASRCLAADASVIGHLKCLLRAGGRRVRCNLTSMRTGARCDDDGLGPLSLQGGADLDLVVLVYGLSATTIDRLATETLNSLLQPLGLTWEKKRTPHDHE